MNKKLAALFTLTAVFFTSCQTFRGLAENLDLESTLKVAASIAESTVSVAKATEVFTPKEEYIIGRSVANSICSYYDVENSNQKNNEYLNKICGTLVLNSEKPSLYKGYHVILVKSDDINAISTPGGHIFVTDRLLKLCNSEDEVAAVLAHEIAHIQLQHSIKIIKSKRTLTAIENISQSVELVDAISENKYKQYQSELSEANSEITSALFESGFSKAQEYDADKFAAKLLDKAGYNSKALITVLEQLDKIQMEESKGKSFYEYLEHSFTVTKTHPAPKYRIAEVSKHTNNNNVAGMKKRQERFYNFKANL